MLREADGREHELQRLDIKNRAPLPEAVEQTLIARLRQIVPHVHGVIIADQVQERNCGVITDRVRDEIAALARAHPQQVFVADSRERIGLFREVIVKPNLREASQAVGVTEEEPSGLTHAEACAAELSGALAARCSLPLGAEGILVCTGEACRHVPAVPVTGPIDVVGAGDSVMAGIVAALCAGAGRRKRRWSATWSLPLPSSKSAPPAPPPAGRCRTLRRACFLNTNATNACAAAGSGTARWRLL